MKKVFCCDICAKQFQSETDCLNHECFCGSKNIPIKVIILTAEYKIEILEYPAAKIKNNEITFIETSCRSRWVKLTQLNLDQIRKTDWGELIIYTTDFSRVFEEECITRLLDEAKNNVKKMQSVLTKKLEILNNLSKNPIIDRQLNANAFAEDIMIN
jgi:hypothetical protein